MQSKGRQEDGCVETIEKEERPAEVEEQIADGRVLKMIEGYLKQGIMDGLKEWEAEKGTPQVRCRRKMKAAIAA
jgi:hypothetical protein